MVRLSKSGRGAGNYDMTTPATVKLDITVNGNRTPGWHVTIARVTISEPQTPAGVFRALSDKWDPYLGRNVVYTVKGTPEKWGANSFFIDFFSDKSDSFDTVRKLMFLDLESMPGVEVDTTRYKESRGLPPQHVDTRGQFIPFTTGVRLTLVVATPRK